MKIHLIYATKDYTKKLTIINGQDMANVKKEIKRNLGYVYRIEIPELDYIEERQNFFNSFDLDAIEKAAATTLEEETAKIKREVKAFSYYPLSEFEERTAHLSHFDLAFNLINSLDYEKEYFKFREDGFIEFLDMTDADDLNDAAEELAIKKLISMLSNTKPKKYVRVTDYDYMNTGGSKTYYTAFDSKVAWFDQEKTFCSEDELNGVIVKQVITGLS